MTGGRACPHCGGSVDTDDAYCTHCGGAVPPQSTLQCSECGRPLAEGDQFCTSCGRPVSGLEPVDEADPWRGVLAQLRAATSGRFEIERELGQGGMAAVYLAHELALRRKVAIKIMSPAVLMEKGMLGRFKQEAVTIAALRHPNVITVHAVEHHDQLHFFVLDYVEGGSLERVIGQYGPLPVPVVKAWLGQVGGALEYAHRSGVVHRDVKPANVLLDRDGNAVVTDFGIAKVTEKSGLTMTGTTMGTPAYMSPEQCLARPVTGASDQYSLGIVAYQMLTGRTPFTGSALATMRAHTEELPEPIESVRPDCPADLAGAIARMLEKDPKARWPRVSDAIGAFQGVSPGLDDPLRQQMAALATGRSPAVAVTAAPTPETPVPGAAVEQPAVGGLGRHTKTIAVGGIAVVVAGALFMLAPWKRETAPDERRPAVASIGIAPTPESLMEGDSARLRATPVDSTGVEIADLPVVWSSSDDAVATVTDGLVKAAGAGRATISAMAGGQAGVLDIVVTAPDPEPTDSIVVTVASVRVAPASVALAIGERRRFEASPSDARGRRVGGRRIAWRSLDAGVATVAEDGEVQAVAAGAVEIVATVEGVSGRATVTVAAEAVASVAVAPSQIEVSLGRTARLSAIVTGARGGRLDDRAVDWRSTDPSVAAVTAGGEVTGLAAGSAVITASSGGQAGEARVTVLGEPVITPEMAREQANAWIDAFIQRLDRAIRSKDVGALERAYEVTLPDADRTEWQTRFGLDGDWSARPAARFPVELFGDTWLVDFLVEIEYRGSGRTNRTNQRFRAGFQAGPQGLVVRQLRLQIGS